MRPRHLLVALLAPALLALPAEAAPKKDPCGPIFTDARDPNTLGDDLDVVRGALAVTKTTLTFTLTLAAPLPTGPYDHRMPGWGMTVSTGGKIYSVALSRSALHDSSRSRYGKISGSSVVWTVPRPKETGSGALVVTGMSGHSSVGMGAGGARDYGTRGDQKPVTCPVRRA